MQKEKEKKGAWTVITPAGIIYIDDARRAHEYKTWYGYPVIRTKEGIEGK